MHLMQLIEYLVKEVLTLVNETKVFIGQGLGQRTGHAFILIFILLRMMRVEGRSVGYVAITHHHVLLLVLEDTILLWMVVVLLLWLLWHSILGNEWFLTSIIEIGV
jgi:hypothetical protein